MPIGEISRFKLIVLTAVFLVLVDNYSFFSHVTEIYPLGSSNLGFLISVFVVFVCLLVIVFCLFSSRFIIKPVLVFLIIISSFVNYFSNTYNVIIDETMIQNTMETNISESIDLFTFKLVFYVFIFGFLPSLFVYKIKIKKFTFNKSLMSSVVAIIVSLSVIVVCLIPFNKFYTSFFREHKFLRYYTNPIYPVNSVVNYINKHHVRHKVKFKQIGLDAAKDENALGRKLTILVVGEAARADKFSLNGYERETNPLLKKEDIINFSNMYSCGTTTAVSVPCMFSCLDRENYSDKVVESTNNILDILARGGVNILWRDNNSSSKGVADRLLYESYQSPERNKICDPECRDVGMLVGLQDYIDRHEVGDILIVLHQMGNHGPAYYKRYPDAFEKFEPVCKTNQLEECEVDSIVNAYDNAILYTDYFLSQTVELLRQNNEKFQAAMIYMSDHGESLGEGGLYLHGMPYFIAPETQKHVAALMWFSESSKRVIDTSLVAAKAADNYSHDNLFHTLLGLMQVKTSLYDRTLDILSP